MIVDSAHYMDGVRQHEATLDIEQAAELAKGCDGSNFVWLGIRDPEPGELDRLQAAFDLHPLAVEDAQDEHGRPKVEDYDDSFFVVLRTARYDDAREEVDFGEVHLFLGSGYMISVRHGEASGLADARRRLEAEPELLTEGPASAVWAVLDKVVDDYQPVVEGIDNDIQEVEGQVFGEEGDSTERIYFLKREVIEFHRVVFPLLAPLEALQRGAYAKVGDQVGRYLRDVADHAKRVDEQVHSQRELLTSILESNLALVSVRQNEVVRAISAWAAIIAVPTFIASIYGMNFQYIPELDFHYGYFVAVGLMLVAILVLHRFFKRINWL